MNNSTAASILARSKKEKVSHEELMNAAYLIGSAGGTIGGPARAQALSADQRKTISSHAANMRWGKPCGCRYC